MPTVNIIGISGPQGPVGPAGSISGLNNAINKQIIFNINNILSGDSNFTWDTNSGALNINQGMLLPDNPLAIAGSGIYLQVNIQNRATGISSSSDYIATSDIGTDTTGYIDIGINNSQFSDPTFPIFGANDGYIYTNGGNTFIGTQTTGKSVQIFTDGTLTGNLRAIFNSNGLNIIGTGNVLINGIQLLTSFSGFTTGISGNLQNQISQIQLTGNNFWSGINQFTSITPIKLSNTATGGIQIYNTLDQTGNYERVELLMQSNTATLRSTRGGAGNFRSLSLLSNSAALNIKPGATTAGTFEFVGFNANLTNQRGIRFSSYQDTSVIGIPVCLELLPTYNQIVTSGVGSTDFQINRSEIGVGTGNHLFVSLQVNGGMRFSISNSGNIFSSGGLLSASSNIGIGYTSGAGGIVTQLTNKNTAVTLNRVAGQIVLNNSTLNSGAISGFTFNNSSIGYFDVPNVVISSGATIGAYIINIDNVTTGSCQINIQNRSSSPLSEAPVLNYVIFKGINI